MTQEDQEENSQAEKSSVSLIYVTFTKVISCDFFSFLSQKESKGEAPQTGFYSLHWPVLVTCSKLFSMLLLIKHIISELFKLVQRIQVFKSPLYG